MNFLYAVKSSVSGPINGTFIGLSPWVEDLTVANLPTYFKELKSLGINKIIIQTLRQRSAQRCDGPPEWIRSAFASFDPDEPKPNLALLPALFAQAKIHHISIYVGLSFSADFCGLNASADPARTMTINDTDFVAQKIVHHFGNHPSLAGFYISDEPPIAQVGPDKRLEYTSYYYHLVKAVRKHNQSLPILTSPGLGTWGINDPYLSPLDLALRTRKFMWDTGVDIFLFQDAMGSRLNGKTNLSNIGLYFQELSRIIGKEKLWANHETFNPFETSGSTMMARLQKQIEAVPDALISGRVVWIQQYNMSKISPLKQSDANRLLESYLDTYRGGGSSKIRPVSPTSIDLYADPFNEHDPNWKKVDTEHLEIVIDLGEIKKVQWVALQMMRKEISSIRFPDMISILCSENKGSTYRIVGSASPPKSPGKGDFTEFVFSNAEPLNSSCDHLKLILTRSRYGWMFYGALEIF